jgi:hypothetical protein
MRRAVVLIMCSYVGSIAGQESATLGESYFPLAIGGTWTYRVSLQDERFVVRAVRKEMVGDQTCVVLEGSLKDQVVASEHVAFTRNGLCRFRADRDDITPPLSVFRPPSPRKGWRSDFQLGGRSATANFFVSQGETTVPFGKVKTVAVYAEINEGGSRVVGTSAWYADGIGMVKQEVGEGKRQPLTLELEKFVKGDEK